MNVIGLDACKYGWCGIGKVNSKLIWGCFRSLDELMRQHEDLTRVLIDIPIGLSSKNFTRTIDSKARTHLKSRKSSIFSPPCREALYACNYREALQVNKKITGKGISIQAYNIGSKIKTVDSWHGRKPDMLEVYEAHPELCFKTLNENKDLEYSKHDKAGIEERKTILFNLQDSLPGVYENLIKAFKRNQVKPDDILDAMALFVIADRSKKLQLIKDENGRDETDKNVSIVYG